MDKISNAIDPDVYDPPVDVPTQDELDEQARADAEVEAILKGEGNNEAPADPDQDPGHPDVAGQPAPA